ncbi:CatB-related O-acetyltransferase [Sinorhizobium sp. BJ1]|uniref:CatB-related O-acetyltransferase n=1 Tax=Sinorhizobium sp. BJ1 TaxID=2035455 RepID=UPI0015CF28D8|nr:CatB-related O-acetyltransferase [Sinorhizobium sp. BJ1]
MQITITAEHVEFLRENRIFLNSGGLYDSTWLRVGMNYNAGGRAMVEPYSAVHVGPKISAVGAFSYSKSYFPPDCFTIGRYCAIAEKAAPIASNHPQGRIGMSGFDYSPIAPFAQFERDKGYAAPKTPPRGVNTGSTVIGNDVWIGQEAMIKRGITIGHGAVIAARSIVTKDVPPYAVVAGAPAEIKKFRFPEPLIERLLASEWWNYSYDQFAGMDTTDPLEFLPSFEDAKAESRIQPHSENRIDVHAAFRRISQAMAA